MEVVNVNRRRIGRLPRGEYRTGVFPTTTVDPVAVKVEKGPTPRKYDRELGRESNNGPRGAPLESAIVLHQSGQGK